MDVTIRLLVVEDDDSQYETYEDTANEILESDSETKFELTRQKSSKEAQAALLSTKFDAAIVDLNLDASDSSEASGNEILEKMIGSHRFPVLVVSGNLGKLSERVREKESLYLRCYDRDKPNNEIFDEIEKICRTGITRILGGRGLIEQKLTEIFWSHLASDLDVWLAEGGSSEKALLRYTINHLSEYLDLPTEGEEYYREAEYYIKPPIREAVATGDIAEHDGSRFIVLSPACDIAIRGKDDNGKPLMNAKRLTLARLFNVDRSDFIKKKIIKEDDNAATRTKALEKIIQGQQDKYVFLPSYKELSASVIDLQNLYTIKWKTYIRDYKRVATIAGPFLKDIQSRFSSYYGRQGQPDLDKKELVKKHKSDLSPSS